MTSTTLDEPPRRMSGLHDFDFLAGRWSVLNRRLQTRLAGARDWIEFPAISQCEPRLGGGANVDQIDFPTLGFSGLTLRLFDRARQRWSIYWINSRDGLLTPPVHGQFEGDRGTFLGEDEDGGRPVEVRFTWLRQGPQQAEWSQAFRPRGADEQAWETNWVMRFERLAGT